MLWRARPLWIALALALGTGCAGGLDFAGMQGALASGPRPAAPALIEGSPIALPPPEGVSAMSGELRTVPLRWDPVIGGDVGGYLVERAFAAEGPFTRVAVLAGSNTTLWVDNGAKGTGTRSAAALGDGVTAFYRVRCFAESGRIGAEASGVVSAATAPPPEPPSGLRAYSHQPRQVPLSWKASDDPDVTAYRVYRSPSFRGPFEPLATVDGRFQTIYADTGLGDLRVFYYRVAALNRAGGEGRPSEPVRAVTKPEPLPPLGLGVAAQRLGANRLSWQPNVESNLVGYRLSRQREGSEAHEPVATLAADQTTAEDAAVAADERVSYQLVAVDEDGLASDPTQALAVTSVGYELSATARADGVHLSWNPRVDEGYRGAHVFRHGAVSRSELGFVTGASFVDAGAKPGGQYRYTVVLERADATFAPPSSPVEIRVPER
jgi:fibronectin type 3 domain-containing protein